MIEEKINPFLESIFSFYEKLSEEEKEIIRLNTQEINFSKGEKANSPNDCRGVFIVEKGELRVYLLSEGGKEVTLYRLGEGQVCALSASCLLENITFDVFVDAEKDSKVHLIGAAGVARLKENVYFENFILNQVIDKFSEAMWSMEQILFFSLDQRLATFLYDESIRTKSTKIMLTHDQIARYMGSAREAVSRMLKYFQKEGWVNLVRGGIEIVDLKKLRSII